MSPVYDALYPHSNGVLGTAEVELLRARIERLESELAEARREIHKLKEALSANNDACHDEVHRLATYTTRAIERMNELEAELAEARRDVERFAWYFGSDDKMPFMKTYIDGLAEGFTLDQWRAAIDAARKETP